MLAIKKYIIILLYYFMYLVFSCLALKYHIRCEMLDSNIIFQILGECNKKRPSVD